MKIDRKKEKCSPAAKPSNIGLGWAFVFSSLYLSSYFSLSLPLSLSLYFSLSSSSDHSKFKANLQTNLARVVLVEQFTKRTIAIPNTITQMVIGTINQQRKHLMKDTAVRKVSCVVGNRPMRERGLSTNQIARICRATSSHLLQVLVPGSAKSAESFLTQSPNFYELLHLTFRAPLLSLEAGKVWKYQSSNPEHKFSIDFGTYARDKWQLSKQSLWDFADILLAHQSSNELII